MTKRKFHRPLFPSLSEVSAALEIVIARLKEGEYFFILNAPGSRQNFPQMEQLDLLRTIVSDTLLSRPTLAQYPLEVANDIVESAIEAECTVKWVVRQLQILAYVKSTGQYGYREQVLKFLRQWRTRHKETERYSSA